MGTLDGPTGATCNGVLPLKPLLLLPGILGSCCFDIGWTSLALGGRVAARVGGAPMDPAGLAYALGRSSANGRLRDGGGTFTDVFYFDEVLAMLRAVGHAVATVPYASQGPGAAGHWKVPSQGTYTAFVLPYDWRQSIAMTASALRSVIGDLQNRLPKRMPFTIVGHSMGGLVARYLVEAKGLGVTGAEVDAIVAVGTPHRGAVDALAVLLGLHSKDPAREATKGAVPVFGSLAEERRSATAWDSFLQLVPTQACVKPPDAPAATLTPADLLERLCWGGAEKEWLPALVRLRSPQVKSVVDVLHSVGSLRADVVRYSFLSETASATIDRVDVGRSYVLQGWSPLAPNPDAPPSGAPVRTVFDRGSLALHHGPGDQTVPAWSSSFGSGVGAESLGTRADHAHLMANKDVAHLVARAITLTRDKHPEAHWRTFDAYLKGQPPPEECARAPEEPEPWPLGEPVPPGRGPQMGL